MKKNPSFIIVMTLTFCVLFTMIMIIASDIVAGALQSKPDTGLGFVFAFLMSPILLALAVISFVAAKKMKQRGEPVGTNVRFSFFAALVIVGGNYLYTHLIVTA